MAFYISEVIESNHVLDFTPSDIMRIDFKLSSNGDITVIKYNANNRLLESITYRNFNLSGAEKWLNSHGWTLHDFRFNYFGGPVMPGLRAWRGDPQPIRSKEDIKTLRYKINMFFATQPAEAEKVNFNFNSRNLAFDL